MPGTYLRVWTRAVIAPAWRRATAVWIGAGIAGGIVFGPTGMHPHDLTRLALGVPAVGAVLALTWLLVFVPTARVLVRADGATFLRSLPGPRWSPRVLAAVALVGLQLPWLALWTIGDGARGLAIVVALSAVIALVATWRVRPRVARVPRWRHGRAALRGVYLRALRRRASDALVRGVGLAILAGLVAALVVRNNELAGPAAAVLGSCAIAIVLIPGWVGALLPLVEAQRASHWLASSLGVSTAARIAVLASVVAGVYLAGMLLAVGAAAIAFASLFASSASASVSTIGWLAVVALATSLGMSLVVTRALVGADRNAAQRDDRDAARDDIAGARERVGLEQATSNAPARVVVGAISASALGVLCLGWLGVTGAGALLAVGVCAVLTARPA